MLKFSAVKINNTNYVKGAPEVLLKECNTYYDSLGNIKRINNIKLIENKIKEYTKNGIRVLISISNKNFNIEDLSNLKQFPQNEKFTPYLFKKELFEGKFLLDEKCNVVKYEIRII